MSDPPPRRVDTHQVTPGPAAPHPTEATLDPFIKSSGADQSVLRAESSTQGDGPWESGHLLAALWPLASPSLSLSEAACHQPPLPQLIRTNPRHCTEYNTKGTHLLPEGRCIPGDMSSHPCQILSDKYTQTVCYQPPSQQPSSHRADMLSSETLKEIVFNPLWYAPGFLSTGSEAGRLSAPQERPRSNLPLKGPPGLRRLSQCVFYRHRRKKDQGEVGVGIRQGGLSSPISPLPQAAPTARPGFPAHPDSPTS